MAAVAARDVYCLAVSKDGPGSQRGHPRSVLCGTQRHSKKSSRTVRISLTSSESSISRPTRFNSLKHRSMGRPRSGTLKLTNDYVAAKYSPYGDRIATETVYPVRIWDSDDGRFLVDIPVTLTPWYNNGLLWSNNHLFVVSGSTIKQLDASTG